MQNVCPAESEVRGSCMIENPDHLAADRGPFLDCFPIKICPQQVAEGLLKSMKTNLLMNEL